MAVRIVQQTIVYAFPCDAATDKRCNNVSDVPRILSAEEDIYDHGQLIINKRKQNCAV